MGDVWIVAVQMGSYSDTQWDVDSVWGTEAEAVEHIVRDLGGELSDCYSLGRLVWELDFHGMCQRFGDYRKLMDDGRTYEIIPRKPAAPDWWDDWDSDPTICYIIHREVR